ncbi:MAG: hypothetical protein B6U72_00205 [Candidatus Altiarchaeales archaeon ex4484_2]|nr:MAG: hypothetical protein B6U72_00205 [Candidatus Altiarchaeales archaeon ex4484_2]
MFLETLGFLLFGFVLLVISSEYLVKGLSKIAICLNMNEFTIGFMVVAMATSLPELIIGINSAFDGVPSLSLGNVIGANIIDLTLIVGIIAILRRGIKIETKTVKTDSVYMFLIALLPLALFLDGELSRYDGLILLGSFVMYLWRLFNQERRFRDRLLCENKRELYVGIFMAIVCVCLLYVSANIVVDASRIIAEKYLMVPPILVGLLMLSFGTTLPELTFETRAIFMKHQYMALGDLIGSVILNSSLVLGVTSIICPITADPMIFMTSAFFLVVVAFLFMTFVEAEGHILWQEGVALILLYVLFLIFELNLNFFENGGMI